MSRILSPLTVPTNSSAFWPSSRTGEASAAYADAIGLSGSEAERELLERKRAAL